MRLFLRLTAILSGISLILGSPLSTAAFPQANAAPGCSRPVYLPLVVGGQGNGQPASSALPAPAAANGSSTVGPQQPDFNGDGCADLVIGVPWEDFVSNGNEGAVHVVYGGAHGLTALDNQFWSQYGGTNIAGDDLGAIQVEDHYEALFGWALAAADFNGDGYTDLAVGAPNLNDTSGGAVNVLYGSATGLVAAGNQLWTQAGGWVDEEGDGTGVFLGNIYGGVEAQDRFGSALAAGDFDGDGYADLAIGVPYEALTTSGNGAVNVLFGSADGLTWVGNQFFSQDDAWREENGTGTYASLGDLIGGAEGSDEFGHALTAADFDNDGYDDLVIGVPYEDIGALVDAGAVHVLRGSASGLIALGNQIWHQQAAYVDTNGDGAVDITLGDPTGLEEGDDLFGYALAARDFDGDGYADLAVSAVGEDIFVDGVNATSAGVVHVFYGSAGGPVLAGQNYIEQNLLLTAGVVTGNLLTSPPESGDHFGSALTAADLNGDGYSELVMGAYGQDLVSSGDARGAVVALFGGSGGLGIAGHLWITQAEVLREGLPIGSLVVSSAEDYNFGEALAAADFNNDGYDELAIGITGAEPGGTGSGAVTIILGSAAGLITAGNQLWSQEGGQDDQGSFLGDLVDQAEDRDYFGMPLR
jgi:hypothetical protein